MEKSEVATEVRKAIMHVLCESVGLSTKGRPVIEALDTYLGFAEIAQRVVVRLGLDVAEQRVMTKLALCVGINDYPGTGADLNGCLNDVADWSGLLEDEGFEVVTLVNAQATKANVVAALRAALSRLKEGDEFVFQYSGHGSNVPDTDGDEDDARDECLVLYDFSDGGLLTDDEMFRLLCDRQPGSHVLVISDSCHSGTMLRFAGEQNHAREDAKPRFLDPVKIGVPERKAEAIVHSRSRTVEGVTLISGCADTEFSYDTRFNGRPNGAFTYTALQALKVRQGLEPPSVTSWFEEIRKTLPSSGLPQTPQLTAGDEAKMRHWF